MKLKKHDLREILKDAHAHFYFLKGNEVERLRLWNILEDSIIIDIPFGAPMRKTLLGYIPSLQGDSVYEIDGKISSDPIPDQMDNTVRIIVGPENIKKVNRRIYPRYNFAPPIDAKISPSGEKTAFSGKIINISAGGLRIEAPVQLVADKKYIFEFDVELDNEAHSLSLDGTIVYEIPEDAGFAYGVRFGEPPLQIQRSPTDEVPVETLDRTIDIMSLVNRLIIRGEEEK